MCDLLRCGPLADGMSTRETELVSRAQIGAAGCACGRLGRRRRGSGLPALGAEEGSWCQFGVTSGTSHGVCLLSGLALGALTGPSSEPSGQRLASFAPVSCRIPTVGLVMQLAAGQAFPSHHICSGYPVPKALLRA